MFNVTIIKLKDLIKIVFVIIIICVFFRILFKTIKINNTQEKRIEFNISDFIKFGINNESSIIKAFSGTNLIPEEKTEDVEETSFNKKIQLLFKTATNIFNSKNLTKIETTNSGENNNNKIIEENTKNKIEENAKTEIVTPNPIKESYDQEYNGIKIKNETDYELTDDILNPNDLNINQNNIIIFHTHTCESYTSSESYYYESTGNYRTTDLNYTVSKVGDELTNCLGDYGFNINHNSTYHDYPSYTGSYNRSLSTVEGILQNFNSDIIIDLHRDAIGSNNSYAPTVKIGEDYCSQLMFVMGTNGGGLYHPDWSSNLKFAIKIQEKANEVYPGLFKPLILRNSRYNQHLGKAACIIEVGATGNTLDESINSMKYLAKIMSLVLK